MTNQLFYSIVLVFFLHLSSRGQTPGFIQTMSHQAVHLDTTDGRKVLIVILPTQPDTALTGQLARFQNRHSRQVRVIAIAAPGATALAGALSPNGYGSLPGAGVILTQGIADGDSTAGPRSGILKYLSRKSRNRQIDRFAEGSKYFLSEKGRLFAQLGKTGSLDSRLADYIVQTNVPGESRY